MYQGKQENVCQHSLSHFSCNKAEGSERQNVLNPLNIMTEILVVYKGERVCAVNKF